ncbi:MAG: DUF484 family protein [Pseudomonadota bacterium]|nr:DUF484 family protein [Pseudomonadota bacterium]
MTVPLDSATVAAYLAGHPDFFSEQVALLAEVKLSSPLTGKTVSLQERQMEVMRAKYAALELRMQELTQLAEENAAIANRFHGWTQDLLRAHHAGDMPRALLAGLQSNFNVPHATLRLWEVADSHSAHWFAQGVSDDARIFANSLRAPYCGSNHDFEAVRWLDDAADVRSTVILPLAAGGHAFGLLILGSPDPERFRADMGTAFLTHIGETASVALAGLRS